MIASAHISAGLVAGMLGARVPANRAVASVAAFVIGVGTHVALDAIPHADYATLGRSTVARITLLEALGVLALALAILRKRMTPGAIWCVLAGVAGATLPDIRFVAGLVLNAHDARVVTRATYWFHGFFHADEVSFKVGMITQVTATIVALGALLLFPKSGKLKT